MHCIMLLVQVLRFLQDLGIDQNVLHVQDTGCLGGMPWKQCEPCIHGRMPMKAHAAAYTTPATHTAASEAQQPPSPFAAQSKACI